MSYCTQIGIEPGDIMPARISESQLLQLATEDDTVDAIDQGVIDDAIEAADAEIDSYCAVKYSVPFSTVPKRIKNLSADIATYNLFKKRSATVGMPESIRDSYEDAIAFLKDVSAGKASLGIDPPPASNSVTHAKVKSNDRVFTRDTMKGF
jgi:phage gp36-like protein